MGRTKDQLKAISSKGNVIVSAGAGSGKTSVLTERVFTNIINGIKLDELLILTFTNNAANEMKERIKDALAKNENTMSLVPFVDSANICTFDSYFLYLVKKYSSKLNISPDIKIVPDDVIKIKKIEVLQGLFEKYADIEDERFIKLINNYSQKDVDNLTKFIMKIDDIVSQKENKYEFINSYYDNFLSNEVFEKFKNNVINNFFKDTLKELESILLRYEELAGCKKILENIQPMIANPNIDFFTEQDFESLFLKQVRSQIEDENEKERVQYLYKTCLKDVIKALDYKNFIAVDLKNNQELMPFVMNIVKELEIELDKYKTNKQSYTFNDIALMAENILRNNNDIRLEIKNKLKLIMIDEYQDTSKFQEEFINLIADDNVFVVGDVKQSIYGFRNANPQQFIDKYELYKDNLNNHQKIDMNENFRSRHEVNDQINDIFSQIMTLKYGGADYINGHIIKSGNDLYDKYGKTKNIHGITKIDYIEKEEDQDELIIHDIKSRIDNKMQVFDKETNTLRDVTYKDFTILASKKTKFEDIEQKFFKSGIPINAIYDENIISDDSIVVLINILKFINECFKSKPNYQILKHTFFSIARSFLFEYDDQKLYELSLDNKYKNDEKYLSLRRFSFKNKGLLIQEIYLNVLNEFNFVDKLSLLGEAISKIKFNKIFYERTKIMDDLGFELEDFILFLEKLSDLDIKMQIKKNSSGANAVTLTSIHQSKGLEYPIVYLSHLYDKGKGDDSFSTYFVHDKFGFYLPSLYNCKNQSLHKIFAEAYIEKDNVSEKIRLLYVALTRAKEEAIILFRHKENNNGDLISCSNIEKAKYLGHILECYNGKFKESEYLHLNTNLDNYNTKENIICEQTLEIKKLNYEFKETKIVRASKELKPKTSSFILHKGTHMHLLMETLDFKNPNLMLIDNLEEREMIKNVLNNSLFKNIKDATIYKEYEYHDNELNYTGIIDLMLEYEDHIDIIDYKLKNIDDLAYNNQLNQYRNYIFKTFKKKVYCYLLSLSDNSVREIEYEK